MTSRSRVTVKVTSDDQKWLSFRKLTERMSNSWTVVGFPKEKKTISDGNKPGSGRPAFSNMADVAEIAAYNEFGTKRIPARPFFRPAFDEAKEKLKELQVLAINNILSGKWSVAIGVGRIGEFMASQIRKKIREVKTPPLHPMTIARKKSTKPLIDTGQMIQNVSHVDFIDGTPVI